VLLFDEVDAFSRATARRRRRGRIPYRKKIRISSNAHWPGICECGCSEEEPAYPFVLDPLG
jgi:hypothetical protein